MKKIIVLILCLLMCINTNASSNDNPYITRGEFFGIADEILNLKYPAVNIFSDLDDNNFYKEPILRLFNAKIINGFNGEIMPNNYIKRCDAIRVINKMFKTEIGSDDKSFLTKEQAKSLIDENAIINAKSNEKYDKTVIINEKNAKIINTVFNENVIVSTYADVKFENCKFNKKLIVNSYYTKAVILDNCEVFEKEYKNEDSIYVVEKKPEKSEEKKEKVFFSRAKKHSDDKKQVTISVEASTIGVNYIIPPVKMSISENENVANILLKVLEDNNLEYICSGSADEDFYLSAITNIPSYTPNIPEDISIICEDYGYEIDEERYEQNCLREFDFTNGSGFMYCVNNKFPNTSMSNYFPKNNDEIKIMFTLSLGNDIGEVNLDE